MRKLMLITAVTTFAIVPVISSQAFAGDKKAPVKAEKTVKQDQPAKGKAPAVEKDKTKK